MSFEPDVQVDRLVYAARVIGSGCSARRATVFAQADDRFQARSAATLILAWHLLGRARAVLGRALRRLEALDRRYAPEKRLRAQAVSVVQRLGWRAVSRLIPGPAFNTLRVTVALVKAPAWVITRGMGLRIER